MTRPYLFIIAVLLTGNASAAEPSSSGPVKDANAAIQIAVRVCRDDEHRPDLWHATLNGKNWDVWQERSDVPGARAAQSHINATDGTSDGCEIVGLPIVDIFPEEPKGEIKVKSY